MVASAFYRTTTSGKDALAVVVEGGGNDGTFDGLTDTQLRATPVDVALPEPQLSTVLVNDGVYKVITADNVDNVVVLPPNVVSIVIWFVTSATDATMVEGRVCFASDATLITGITGTDAKMGYQPPMPTQYAIPSGITHLHVSGKANTVVKGFVTTKE